MLAVFLPCGLVRVHALQLSTEFRVAQQKGEHLLAVRPDDGLYGSGARCHEAQLRRSGHGLADEGSALHVGPVVPRWLDAVLLELRAHVSRGHQLVLGSAATSTECVGR